MMWHRLQSVIHFGLMREAGGADPAQADILPCRGGAWR